MQEQNPLLNKQHLKIVLFKSLTNNNTYTYKPRRSGIEKTNQSRRWNRRRMLPSSSKSKGKGLRVVVRL
ncbi:hypothetical protein HanPSC8_Chr14g0623581 [Helianthus annuus]|nr:hypothetical protein HanPSC8_Chr14g0623581 [Helianthus annuus]